MRPLQHLEVQPLSVDLQQGQVVDPHRGHKGIDGRAAHGMGHYVPIEDRHGRAGEAGLGRAICRRKIIEFEHGLVITQGLMAQRDLLARQALGQSAEGVGMRLEGVDFHPGDEAEQGLERFHAGCPYPQWRM